jgi:DivIVA domain-containing protein
MIDLASIRNASFTLTPTGYNPEEVDRFLADLADRLAEELSNTPVAVAQPQALPEPAVEQLQPIPAPLIEALQAHEEAADIDGLRETIDRTIGAMNAFVANELAALAAATEVETDELLRERERLLDEAGEAARAHLDETRTRAENMLAEAKRDGDAMRSRFQTELQADRERFEQSLAERDAQAQARIAELVAEAELRRKEADEVAASAARVQSQVLASLEMARASLSVSDAAPTALRPEIGGADVHVVEPVADPAGNDAFPEETGITELYGGTNDAAA